MEEKDPILVSCCADCPFIANNKNCSIKPEIEIDEITMEDDIPVECPMMNGKPIAHGEDTVQLEKWLLPE